MMFIAINGSEFGKDRAGVYYLAPHSFEWESMGTHYSDFLRWAFSGNLILFCQKVRWDNWRNEISSLSGQSVYSFLIHHSAE
ncbi:DUF2625 family protein [Candidatus Pantoea gossypiicola]|uniref:DUF2625 family protein n=2 Tax=Erwiniaceae TaxID=1903409 RepID=UPI0034E1B929